MTDLIEARRQNGSMTPATLVAEAGAAKGDSLDAEARFRQTNREGWETVIDENLIEWGRKPESLAADDIKPPTNVALRRAIATARDLRDRWDMPAPTRVVPTGDGGILFERGDGTIVERLEIASRGTVEYVRFHDGRIVERHSLELLPSLTSLPRTQEVVPPALRSESSPDESNGTWKDRRKELATAGLLVLGTQRKTPLLLEPPAGPGPAGVLDALLEERGESR